MTPAIHPLSDDRDKAMAVCEDMLKFLQKFRVGIFARLVDAHRIALSDPIGKGPITWKDSKREAPHKREFVTEWRDFCNVDALISHEAFEVGLIQSGASMRALEIINALGQVLHHYQSAIIPAPVAGLPTMLLCDGQMGNWRAYSVVAELDCYGYTERGIKPRVTQ